MYIPVVWLALLIGQSMGNGLPELLQNLMVAMQTPLEVSWTEDSLSSVILCSGAYLVGLLVYFSTQRNTRDGEEHGSAVWGSAREVNRQFAQKKNKILTREAKLEGYRQQQSASRGPTKTQRKRRETTAR